MQDFDTTSQDAEPVAERNERLEQLQVYLRLIFKRILVFVCFGPGVLGCLWLIGRIIKR
jgi:hypothetical protein